MDDLRTKVNRYVESSLSEYTPSDIKSPKVIHDPILGTNAFYKHEIMIIDSPIIQRLRRISQVDLVPLVFPSGNHNRFEHSLGVTVIADKLVNALINNDVLPASTDAKDLRNHVRMAALLHDCGHGPLSHMSEDIYGALDDSVLEKDQHRELYGGAKPHERLSYLIVTSPAFKQFYAEYVEPQTGVTLNFDLIGRMIIGNTCDKERAFWVDIINGAFDADKLDYIQRDSHFTGIQMILDLDRLFHCLDLIEIDGKIRLTIDFSGIATLEQIVFDKMMLVSTVYNHHKVRAAERIFQSIFDELKINKSLLLGLPCDSAADFLYLTDDDIYNLAKANEDRASDLVRCLLNRKLPKRCLIIAGNNLTSGHEQIDKIMALDQVEQRAIESLIARRAKEINPQSEVTEKDIWIDIPGIPSFEEGSLWPIKSRGEAPEYITLRQVFPIDDWSKAFSENKWKGHLFTWPEYANEVNIAGTQVIQEIFDIELGRSSRSGCKLD